ncbi:type II secretion system protein [Candidatus Saccharibacteria bacterium]|nr:type II secretion system protein [Candidatus Saccharibacteria bacterium]
MQDIKSKKGFTIIEVVLVLAIAGLIFLMVFIALPALQRNQRDRQRTNDYSLLSTSMTNYITSNNGKLPMSLTENDSKKYINESGQDPNGFTYKLKIATCTGDGTKVDGVPTTNCVSNPAITFTQATLDADTATEVYVVKNAGCDAGFVTYKKSSRAFAIYGQLESGNGTYCSASS